MINLKNEVVLNPETLYNWDFKIDARGYRPQEVDKALDIVISDYKAYDRKVAALQKKIEEQKLREKKLEEKRLEAELAMKTIKEE